jgi:hypothetical protein
VSGVVPVVAGLAPRAHAVRAETLTAILLQRPRAGVMKGTRKSEIRKVGSSASGFVAVLSP